MNRLQYELSPYLRCWGEDSVDWYPWGQEAFARAQEEHKPMLISIGTTGDWKRMRCEHGTVARLTERLLVMNGSALAMDGTPDEVFARAEELVKMGLDIPDVTRVFMQLRKLGLPVPPVYTTEQATKALLSLKEGK